MQQTSTFPSRGESWSNCRSCWFCFSRACRIARCVIRRQVQIRWYDTIARISFMIELRGLHSGAILAFKGWGLSEVVTVSFPLVEVEQILPERTRHEEVSRRRSLCLRYYCTWRKTKKFTHSLPRDCSSTERTGTKEKERKKEWDKLSDNWKDWKNATWGSVV